VLIFKVMINQQWREGHTIHIFVIKAFGSFMI
jgi:hypothetical protein